jgi:putative restriction endonuclease
MDSDSTIRQAAFAHLRRLMELRDVLSAEDLSAGFQYEGTRIPLLNPRRGPWNSTVLKSVYPH